MKQLNHLVEVLTVDDRTDGNAVERETVLIKVHAPVSSRAALAALAVAHGAKIVDIGLATIVVELTDVPEYVDRFIEILRPLGIRESARSGCIALRRTDPVTRGGAHPRSGNGARPRRAGVTPRGPARQSLRHPPSPAPGVGFGESDPTAAQADGAS